jgi:hypothetical protein
VPLVKGGERGDVRRLARPDRNSGLPRNREKRLRQRHFSHALFPWGVQFEQPLKDSPVPQGLSHIRYDNVSKLKSLPVACALHLREHRFYERDQFTSASWIANATGRCNSRMKPASVSVV